MYWYNMHFQSVTYRFSVSLYLIRDVYREIHFIVVVVVVTMVVAIIGEGAVARVKKKKKTFSRDVQNR